MIYAEKNIIDLSNIKDSEYIIDITVVSKKENGKFIPFSVEMITSQFITSLPFGENIIRLSIDVPNILTKEYIVLKNANKETTKIIIKPNDYFTMERKYKFKITRKTIDKNGALKLKIQSMVNDTELGWKCTYMGQPINYIVTPLNSDKSDYVIIENPKGSMIFQDIYSLFEFVQDESNETISYTLHNTPNGIVID